MYDKKKNHSIYRVWYYWQFQAFTEGLEIYPPWIRGEQLYLSLPSL